jgi:hypothetical protein
MAQVTSNSSASLAGQAPGSGIGAGAMGMLSDPSIRNAGLLAIADILRNVARGKSIPWKEAGIIGAADWVYQKFIYTLMIGPLSKISGEIYYSSMLSEMLGVSGLLLISKKAGLSGLSSTGDVPDGLVNPPRLASGMLGDFIDSLFDSGELMFERGILSWGLSKTGVLQN